MKVSGFNVIYIDDILEEFTPEQAKHIDPLVLNRLEEAHFFSVENATLKVYFYWYDREVFFVNRDAREFEDEIAADFCLPEDIFWDVMTALGDGSIEARHRESLGRLGGAL